MKTKISIAQIIFSIICWPGEVVGLLWLIIDMIYKKIPIESMGSYANGEFRKKLANKYIQHSLGVFNTLVYIWIFS